MDLVPLCRKAVILYYQGRIKKYAVGYCDGERLSCRPKIDTVAIMYHRGDIVFWSHLNRDEYEQIFNA